MIHRRLLAEMLGTFWLVLIGPGAAAANAWSDGAVTQAGIALAFCSVLVVTVSLFGPVSGAHFNPAVTTGLFLARRFPGREVVPYWVAQLTGGLMAGLELRVLFGPAASAATTRPAIPVVPAVGIEAALTALLVLAVLRMSLGPPIPTPWVGVVVGFTVAGAALVAGPLTGASLNPARSLGPAVATGLWDRHWVYWLGPFTGAVLAVGIFQLLLEKNSNGSR